MSGNYGTQVIESVAVRRRRLREAWLFGSDRVRNTLNEHTGKVLGSVMLAAIICAGFAGYGYFKTSMAKQNQQQPGTSQTTGPASPQPSR
ncbi:hypothetical protein HPO96_10335 [Kribbella sandramycini]|uniref:Uncharacterized protein HemX n=1 Tax=Kribbella sandramycini TaxID=60450 RepID=A0A7Y4KXT7_9ACTN|nr:hypothetical protein [Kribbella sandramycini]MBB6569524.1 uncharacterized protein HemX [Kribbella sandramycini]NOL40642.1 hypothetical protein [Kribbella sandramycini]